MTSTANGASPKYPFITKYHAIFQLLNLEEKKMINQRIKLDLLCRAYFEQMNNGCILDQCNNNYCAHCQHQNGRVGGQERIKTSEEIAKMAVLLARDSFSSTPKFYFCECPNLIIPDYTLNNYISMQHASFISIYEISREEGNYKLISDFITHVFSNSEALNFSFYTMDALKKMYNKCQLTPTDIDFEALRHFYNTIQKEKNLDLLSVLIQSVNSLSKFLLEEWKMIQTYSDMRQIIILLQFPFLMEPNYRDTILCRLMECILQLPAAQKNMFKHMLDHVPKDVFSQLVALFQQFITLRLYDRGYIDEQIAYATRMLRILNQVNENKLLHRDKVHYDQFYNDAVNNIVDLEEDYKRWINSLENGRMGNSFEDFSFCQFAFILDPQSKKQILQINVANQQRKQARDILIASLLAPQISSCFLELNIHRERLLQSALNELTEKQSDLKKPLKVHFVGEEGIDDGGLQKEFFQLIIRQIFDVQYGMFEENEQTRTFWFNPNSFEHENNFRLVGTVLGLAIYNDVIFDVRFPLVLYKKLLGMEPTLEDLKDMDPDLGNGLQALLDFQGNVEEVFCRTFQVETEAFGNIIRHDLIPNGAHIPVTEHNRQQYVDLFVKWKLTDSIKKQFNAFHDGFKKVLDSQHILHLFRPEELELMICGSPNLDFDALERVTKYADGFDKNDPYIAWFWEIVKSLSQEDKKKFLCFCTGSDRVPIKGLGSMEFVVAKNGNDSDRLPTAHTCYNYLLIPRYKSKEKLRDRLLTAIQNFQGFGLR